MDEQVLDKTWSAVPQTVRSARRAVVDHLRKAKTADPPMSDIALAVSEAVTNAVRHAYPHRPGPVRVRVEIAPAEIEVMIEDEGTGMSPRPDSPGLGLGLPVIATVAERFDVRSNSRGGTRICIWFDPNPASATL